MKKMPNLSRRRSAAKQLHKVRHLETGPAGDLPVSEDRLVRVPNLLLEELKLLRPTSNVPSTSHYSQDSWPKSSRNCSPAASWRAPRGIAPRGPPAAPRRAGPAHRLGAGVAARNPSRHRGHGRRLCRRPRRAPRADQATAPLRWIASARPARALGDLGQRGRLHGPRRGRAGGSAPSGEEPLSHWPSQPSTGGSSTPGPPEQGAS